MATVQQQQTTQLEFHQAMADFKTMFPSMDDDVIEAVLRSNQGAVDATIDQLLAMSTDNENEKIRLELEQVEDTDSPLTSVSPQIRNYLVPLLPSEEQKTEIGNQSNRVGTPLHQQRGWVPPLLGPLPDDFLRLNPEPPATANKQLEGELEDERIALFLQNEEFMAELRWNKDFLLMLDKDSPPEERMSSFSHVRSTDDDAIFKERLRNMGKKLPPVLNKPPCEAQVSQYPSTQNKTQITIPGPLGGDNFILQVVLYSLLLLIPQFSFLGVILLDENIYMSVSVGSANLGFTLSRKKFSQLARVFTGRKKRNSSAKAILQEEDSDGP